MACELECEGREAIGVSASRSFADGIRSSGRRRQEEPNRKVESVRLTRVMILVLCLACCASFAQPVSAQTGPYVQLQILLPGESPAPGTTSGKTGVPAAQAVGSPFEVRIIACDAQWYPVTSVTNVVALSSTDAVADLPPAGPLTAGEAMLSVTLNAVGTFSFAATDQSDGTVPEAVSGSVTTQVLQGFVFRTISQKHVDAGVAFGTDLTAVDPSGQTVVGFHGTVNLQELTSYGVGRIEPPQVTLDGGTWTGNVTVYRADETNISSGNANMYAYLPGDPTRNGTSNPFVVHPGPLSRVQIVVPGQDPLPGSVSGVTGNPATQSAGQPFSVDVYATDAWWNPLPSADQVRITSSDGAASTPVTVTMAGGFAQANVSLGSIGDQTLTVADLTNGSVSGMTSAPIVVIAAGAHHFEMDPLPAVATAGDAVPVTIRATDAGGNTLPDFSGSAVLTANTGAGSISPEQVTFADGVWSGSITFRGAGAAVQFTCSDYASPPHTGTSDPFVVQPGPYTGIQVLLPGQTPRGGTATGFEGNPDDQTAGTGFDVVIRAVDDYFNRVSGVNSALELTATDANMAQPETVALANGEAVIPVTVYRAGMQSLTAADADSSGIDAGVSSDVFIEHGAFSRVLILAPGEEASPGSEEGRAGEPTDQSINYSFTVTVYATDAWWNPVPGATDQVILSSNDTMAELPGAANLLDGVAELSVRLSTGGYQQISVSNLTQPAMPVSTTQVNMISSGFHLEAEIEPAVVQAGSPFTLTVRVTNDAGSVIQEMNSAITVEVRNASTQEPGRGTLANTSFQLLQGQHVETETYTYAEDIVLVISDDNGNAPATTGVLSVRPGAPAELLLSSDPSWVRANRTAVISARVVDAYGNGVPELPVVFEQSRSVGQLTVLDETTSPEGVAQAEYLSPREPGLETFYATAGGLSAELELQTALVDPDAPGGMLTNYPNPFHPDEAPTTIAYVLDDAATVNVRIFTLSGGLVYEHSYPAGAQGGLAGQNEITWDGRNGDGDAVASGGYILFIEAEGGGTTMHVMRRKIGVVW